MLFRPRSRDARSGLRPRTLARRSAAGFTILEILIAIVILVLGISGIVALFPTAIQSGNKTIEDSYSAAITQSVIDAVSVGMRECRYRTKPDPSGRVWTYFIFDHDGVWDQMAPTPQDYQSTFQNGSNTLTVSQADWCIVLPQGKDVNTDPLFEPVFNYPSVRSIDNLGGGPQFVDHRDWTSLAGCPNNPQAFDDWDPTRFMRPTYKDVGGKYPYIRRAYQLGRYRKGFEKQGFPSPATAPGPVRDEFLGDTMGPAVTGDPTANRAIVDPYPQYSFALSIRRAKTDNRNTAGQNTPDGQITKEDLYSSSLYEVRVFVFRAFISDTALHNNMATNLQYPIPRTNCPIAEFVTLMSL